MKVIHLISGGDSGGAKTHVLSLLQHLNKTITAQMVCFRDGPFADEARAMGIPTDIMGGNNIPRTVNQLTDYIRKGGQFTACSMFILREDADKVGGVLYGTAAQRVDAVERMKAYDANL